MKKTLLLFSFCLPALAFTQSWSSQNSSISNDLNSVSFVDDNNGWAVGRQGKVIHTTNGGATWSEQNSGTTKDLNKVWMVSPTDGFAVGDGGTVIKYNGTSWSVKNINFSQDMYGVCFLDPSNGWISGDYGRIMKTTDGGSSWTTQMDNSTYSNTFNDLWMLSATEGWAVGSSGRVLKYNGTNWVNSSNPASGNLTDLYAVSFSGSSDGFMTGQNSTVFGWDGSLWNSQNTSIPDNSAHVYDVQMLSSTLGYAVTTPGFGGQGMILQYNGNTWTTDYQYSGSGDELFSGITSTPNGDLYAVGAGGMIKKKSSGGSTPTGIATQQAASAMVRSYPNPFSSVLTVDFPSGENGQITLTLKDISGKVVKATAVNAATTGSHSLSLDSSDLPAGFYIYTLNTPATTVIGKVIKD